MRVAFGAMGGAQTTRIAIVAPSHCLRQAGVNARAVAVSRSLLSGFSGHLRFSFEPIVEVAPVFFSAEFVKGVSSLPNLRVLARRSISVAGRPMHRRCRGYG